MKISSLKVMKAQGKEMTDGKVMSTAFSGFQSLLGESDKRYRTEYMNELFNAIDKQGGKLAKSFNINELKLYKRMISEFFNAAVGSSYAYEKEHHSERGGRRTIHSVIKKVNEEVETLMKQVMSGEQNNIDILKRIGEIRGLLIDILM